MQIRDLRADEIEARVQSVTENGCVLLLYKNARCDMNILDETFGSMNWMREHTFLDGKNYCTVSIWDAEKAMWISKQDVGTESDTEAEKGQASDAFKRACFNWGIGRELYTAPFVFVAANNCKITEKNGRKQCYDKFEVASMAIKDKTITDLTIKNARTGKIVYTMRGTVDNKIDSDFDKAMNFEDIFRDKVAKAGKTFAAAEAYVNKTFGKTIGELTQSEQTTLLALFK